MNNDDPATIESVSRNVVEGLAYGHFQPLPYTCFPMDKIQDAMELMKSGRHTGKILLSNLVEDGPGKGGPLTVQSYAAVRFGGEAFHLVLGAAGGVGASLITHAHTRTLTHARSHMHARTRSAGSKLVRWLHRKGARRFIVSVSRDPNGVMTIFEDLIAAGATFEVVEAARQRRVGRGRDIALTAEGNVEVPVASRLFEVVIQNLLDNALIHGGPDAAVHVTVVAAGEEAVIVVADTGRGIPAQHLPFVFQRFYRGDASRTGQGSGLGLALVKHIVEAHGGTVVAESDGATGTTLRVTLPLAD